MSSPPETRRLAGPLQTVDVPRPPPKWRKLLHPWNLFGLLLLIAAVGTSVWRVNHTAKSLYSDQVDIIRIVHWQLELGYRDALQATIDDYNRLQDARFDKGEIKKRVKVVQLPVGEKTYGQLINTNLIAHSAPDLIEIGMTNMVGGAYRAEYFLNMSNLADEPNPYNAPAFQRPDIDPASAAALPRMRWRDTFLDGMAGGFDYDLQGYYCVPTTFAPSGRFAVNLDLLKDATGSDKLPTTLGELLADCAKMRALGESRGTTVYPIAGSQYSKNFWLSFAVSFLADSQRKLDVDLDGVVSMTEVLAGMRAGTWSFNDPAVGDLISAVRSVAAQFPNGFAGMDRESAMLLFTQQQSGFLYCGAWDASSIYRLVGSKFRVAIMNGVLPGPGEAWGPKSPINEASETAACAFGVCKMSPRVDVAIDFLRYWTSQRANQGFNDHAGWVPCIIGSKLPDNLKAFAPQSAGIIGASTWIPAEQGMGLQLTLTGEMDNILSEAWKYNQSPDSTPEFQHLANAMHDKAIDPNYGIDVITKVQDDDGISRERNAERCIAAQSLAHLLAPDRAASAGAYRSLVSNQAAALNGEDQRALRRLATSASASTAAPEAGQKAAP